MAGLLDFLNTPAGMGLLSGVASYAANARKGAPINNIGRGLAGGLAGYQFAQSDIDAQKQQALQNEFRAMQMDEIKAKRAEAEAQKAQMAKFRNELPGMLPPQTPKLSEDQFMQMMPEFEAFGSDAIHDSMKYADQPNPIAKMLANAPDTVLGSVMDKYYGNAVEQLFPKKKEPLKVGKNERVFDPDNYSQIIGSEPDPVDYNKPFLPDGTPNEAYQKYSINNAKAGSPKVVVNPALDPFKNEQALRKEYSDNPLVKSAAEMTNAWRTIESAYQRPSPANDLAMATKYMKILDPTSVVRETEFALAVNATGMMDKVYNYANMIKTGQKLNPTQRKDFYDSAKAINDAFQEEAGKVKNTYRGIAAQYKLNPDNTTLGPEFAPPKPAAPAGQQLPAKPNKMTLKAGVVYETNKGPLMWNGDAFEDVK